MCERVPSLRSSELMLLRATAYQMAGDFYNAIADCGRVLKADKSNMKAYEVSRVACVVIKLLLSHPSSSSPLPQMRGRAHYMLGEHEQAMRHFQEGLRCVYSTRVLPSCTALLLTSMLCLAQDGP